MTNDPLAGYAPDWRKKAALPATGQTDDPLTGYAPDWREKARAAGPATGGQRLRAVAQGATLGWSDEIGGYLRGLTKNAGKIIPAGLRGGLTGALGASSSAAPDVTASIEDERAKLDEYRLAHPIESRVLEFGGAVVPGLLLPGAGAVAGGRALLAGAVAGGLAGAGSGEGGVVARAVPGATGAVLGGAAGFVGGKIAGSLSRKAGDRGRAAALRALTDDEKTPAEVAAAIASSKKPLVLADVGGQNARDLTKVVAQMPGRGKGLQSLVRTRGAEAEERVLADLAETSGQGQRINILDSIDDIARAREREASAAYGAINDVPVTDSRIRAALGNDKIRRAYERARNVTSDENAARALRGEAPGMDLPPIEEMDGANLTLGLLDRVKRGLDDLIGVSKRESGGMGNTEIASLRDLKNAFLEVLDEVAPKNEAGESLYKAARSGFGGKAALMNSLDEGRGVFKTPLDELERTVRGMGQSELDTFRKGGIEATADLVESITQGHDIAKRLGGRTAIQKRLRLLFPSDEAFAAFRDRLRQEAQMHGTKLSVTGGSDTAPKTAVLLDLLGDSPLNSFGGGTSIRFQLLKAGVKKLRERGTRKVAGEIEPYLSAQGDDLVQKLAELADLEAKEPVRRAVRGLAGRGAGYAVGAGVGSFFAPRKRP